MSLIDIISGMQEAYALLRWGYLALLPFLLFRQKRKQRAADASTKESEGKVQTKNRKERVFGSQELLMLPHQYGPGLSGGGDPFPSMSRVSTTLLSCTPSIDMLQLTINSAMDVRPLLWCRVVVSGESDERIDLFQMVRKSGAGPMPVQGAPHEGICQPATCCAWWGGGVETELEGELREGHRRRPWYGRAGTGPLWRLTLHKSKEGEGEGACMLAFASNHTIVHLRPPAADPPPVHGQASVWRDYDDR